MTICRVKNSEEGIEFAYNFLISQLEKSESYNLCISGGSTPEPLFVKLNEHCTLNSSSISKLNICWVDERNVPYDSSRSNYGNIKKVFPTLDNIKHTPIPTGNYLEELPQKYLDSLIQNGFVIDNEFVSNLTILGMGADGHTASIFPNITLKYCNHFVAVSTPENIPEERVTLQPDVINNSIQKLALVFGRDKKNVLKECIKGNTQYPFTAVIQNTIIITDQDV